MTFIGLLVFSKAKGVLLLLANNLPSTWPRKLANRFYAFSVFSGMEKLPMHLRVAGSGVLILVLQLVS